MHGDDEGANAVDIERNMHGFGRPQQPQREAQGLATLAILLPAVPLWRSGNGARLDIGQAAAGQVQRTQVEPEGPGDVADQVGRPRLGVHVLVLAADLDHPRFDDGVGQGGQQLVPGPLLAHGQMQVPGRLQRLDKLLQRQAGGSVHCRQDR